MQVEVCQKVGDGLAMRSVRTVDTGALVWDGSREGLAPIGSPGWPLDEFLLSPFYEQIVRSQCKGWRDISLLLPRLSSRAHPAGTLESIQEE